MLGSRSMAEWGTNASWGGLEYVSAKSTAWEEDLQERCERGQKEGLRSASIRAGAQLLQGHGLAEWGRGGGAGDGEQGSCGEVSWSGGHS